jgi:hypothetical protein
VAVTDLAVVAEAPAVVAAVSVVRLVLVAVAGLVVTDLVAAPDN